MLEKKEQVEFVVLIIFLKARKHFNRDHKCFTSLQTAIIKLVKKYYVKYIYPNI